MADNPKQADASSQGKMGEEGRINEAGKGELDDELLPNAGEPVPQEEMGGDERDTAGTLGEMHPETAKSIDEAARKRR